MSRSRKKKRRRRETLRRLGIDVREGSRFKLGDGWYRVRRGKVVRIPDEWVGKPWNLVGAHKVWRKMKKERRQSQHKKKLQRRDKYVGDIGRVPRDKRQNDKLPKDSNGNRAFPEPKLGHPRNRSPRHVGHRERRARDLEDGLL